MLVVTIPSLDNRIGSWTDTEDLPVPPSSATWGDITGTLSDQADLQTVLDSKGTSDFSGAYADLSGKPTLGTAAATDATDYATAAQGTKADNAVQPTRTVAGHALSADVTVTKADVGLGNCDNTSDANKPISSATQTALNGKQASGSYATGTGTANGTNTGDQTTVSGNAGTATALQTARAINGVNFDGTAAITVAASGATLTGTTLAAGLIGTASTTACAGNDSRLADSRAPNGNAAGDLAGTYPNPTIKASVSLTTPVIGVATGTSLAVTGAITSSGTAGIGYVAGAGGAVTQLTSKATATPAINKMCGTITMNNASLAAAAIVSFVVTNNLVSATDVVHVQHDSAGTLGAYTVGANTMVAATSFKISVRNNTAGALAEAIVLRFAVIKAVVS